MEMRLRIAGIDLDVKHNGDLLPRFCREYRICDPQGAAALTVEVGEREIGLERRIGQELGLKNGSDGYLSTLALLRGLCEHLPDYDAMLFHASALAIEGRAYLFAAPSGTGKSTHASLWRQCFGDSVTMINDDKPILRRMDGVWHACGSPWNGKHRLSTNRLVPIGGICILGRGEKNEITPIDAKGAMPILFGQIQRLEGEEAMRKQMALLSDLLCRTPIYRMHCLPDQEAAMLSYTTMVGGNQ